jgi:hypothetical protein
LIKGKVQLAGDLGGIGTIAAAPIVSNLAITNAKMANMSAVSQLKGASSTSVAVADISMGPSMSILGSALNGNVSFVGGSNPNATAPIDRPSTSNVLYVGQNGSVWVWNGTTYVTKNSSRSTIKKSSTSYSVNYTTKPSATSLSDYSVTVGAGQKYKLTYIFNYQSNNNTNVTPVFGFLGVATSDYFQAAVIGYYSYSFVNTDASASLIYANNQTYYTPATGGADLFTKSNVVIEPLPLVNTNKNVKGLLKQGIPIYIVAYYQNNGSSSTTITPLFNIGFTNPSTLYINGGTVEYVQL